MHHNIINNLHFLGKDFTIAGNFDTWWTNKSTTGFADRSKCFIDQYSKFQLFGRNVSVIIINVLKMVWNVIFEFSWPENDSKGFRRYDIISLVFLEEISSNWDNFLNKTFVCLMRVQILFCDVVILSQLYFPKRHF